MEILVGGTASFIIFHIISHPKALIGRRIPKARVKRIQLLPNLRIGVKDKIIHIHHWVWITPLYIAAHVVDKGIFKSDFLQGALLGGIIQGVLYKDSLKLVHSAEKPFIKEGYTNPLRLLRKII